MAKTATEARRPDAADGTDAIYHCLFDSFNRDKDGRISRLEVLSRLERCGLQPDDPRTAEALAGLAGPLDSIIAVRQVSGLRDESAT
jgi:hypothetical protein